jgi:GNAT-family acetyltransferase (TIGR03103 family)
MSPRTPRSRGPDARFERNLAVTLNHQQSGYNDPQQQPAQQNVYVDCGWGKLVFGHTYRDAAKLAEDLEDEKHGQRNIAFYVRDPHVVVAQAPDRLFLDPSHTFRIWLSGYRVPRARPRGYALRRLQSLEDAEAMNRIFISRHMVPADPSFVWHNRASRIISYVVAEDLETHQVIGAVMGVDHCHAFDDPENGSSLWCLAVDARASHPGVGQALVHYLAGHYQARGRAFMDLSVMHDNQQAIRLYEKLGFQRVPVFAVKRKNAINERLYTGRAPTEGLNPYACIIVEEALRRGIRVDVLDAEAGYFRLTQGGRSVVCRESLSELTSAIAMSRCQDKRVTQRILKQAGLRVPEQREADGGPGDIDFLKMCKSVVVKPADGEQGAGISVDVRSGRELRAAIRTARHHDETVLIERYCPGDDLRIVVIGYKVVAAALRKPPVVVGDGKSTVRELIDKLSRRRAAATGGESTIPMDAETERCVKRAGHDMDEVLESGERLAVRKTANLHTGGTLHDCTDALHPTLVDAAVRAARALEIPVTGLDFLVPSILKPDYVIVEANERPGLANHEPQPTAERFLDLLFPLSGMQEVLRAQA